MATYEFRCCGITIQLVQSITMPLVQPEIHFLEVSLTTRAYVLGYVLRASNHHELRQIRAQYHQRIRLIDPRRIHI